MTGLWRYQLHRSTSLAYQLLRRPLRPLHNHLTCSLMDLYDKFNSRRPPLNLKTFLIGQSHRRRLRLERQEARGIRRDKKCAGLDFLSFFLRVIYRLRGLHLYL